LCVNIESPGGPQLIFIQQIGKNTPLFPCFSEGVLKMSEGLNSLKLLSPSLSLDAPIFPNIRASNPAGRTNKNRG
jgi:hypothetical protein